MALVRIATLDELKPGTLLEYRSGESVAAVCNDGGTLHAFHGECPHLGGPLGQGNLADGNLICPWHGWEFRCATGEADHNPNVKLERYAVVVRDGEVFIEIP